MLFRRIPSAPLALALALVTSPAISASDAELDELRAQVRALRDSYEHRLAELESRLARQAAPAPAPAPAADGRRGFNPEISLTLQGQYRRMKDIDERHLSGFAGASHGDEDGHDHGAGERGFSLDHTELVLAANIDSHYRGLVNFGIADGEVEVEEAWFQSTGLGHGLTLRGGRFLSSIGYLNAQHAHAWDFADAPLMYTALFGEHASYGNDGLQFKWVLPTELFAEMGAEVGRGANFPGTDRDVNGIGSSAVFAHLGGDVGTSHSWRTGLSYLNARSAGRESHFDDVGGEEVEGAFTGRSRMWIADAVWKWAPDGNGGARALTLQAEFFQRREDGDLTCQGEAGSACAVALDSDYRTRQRGWYAQAVYKFHPQWRVGLRHDRLDPGRRDYGANNTNIARDDHAPRRSSVMVDWSPSEFSRLRLQLARDQSMAGETDNQLWLQYVMSLGAHGAHRF
ncbi:MAG: TonB-dependent receptor [Rhodocyclales bacterium]|nr:TonB-dependent receptor [Rhodocyclales bacterium]